MKDPINTSQPWCKMKMPTLIGTERNKAVNAESLRGEIFLVLSIVLRYKRRSYKIQGTRYKAQAVTILYLVPCTLSLIIQIYIQLLLL
jgi:hypothetical protein